MFRRASHHNPNTSDGTPISSIKYEFPPTGGGVNLVATSGDGAPIFYGNGINTKNQPAMIRAVSQETGRPAFALKLFGDHDPTRRTHVADVELSDGSLAQVATTDWEMQRAAILLDALATRYPDQQATALSLSGSAGSLLLAALARPEAFDVIGIGFPNSFAPRLKLHQAMGRAILDRLAWWHSRPKPEESLHFPRPALGAVPKLKRGARLAAAHALKVSSLSPLLHALQLHENAPGVALMIGAKDGIFPSEEVIDALPHADAVDCVVVDPGAHGVYGRRGTLRMLLQAVAIAKHMRAARQQARANGSAAGLGPLSERIYFAPGVGKTERERIMRAIHRVDERTVAAVAAGGTTKIS